MVSVLLILLACGSAVEPVAVAPPSKEPAAADLHAGHSDHMAEMAKTRTALREALGPAYDEPVAGLDAVDPAAGKAAYDTHCASCHGATGEGDGPAAAGLNPPPADFTDAFHARYYSDAARVRIIEQGLPGTAMAGFTGQLNAQQILELYAYVRAFRPGPSAAPAPHTHEDGTQHHH